MRKRVSESIDMGRYQEALTSAIQYTEKVRKYYGNHHPAMLSAINNLALIHKITGNYN